MAALDRLITEQGLESLAAQLRRSKNRVLSRELSDTLLDVIRREAQRPRKPGRNARWTDQHRQDLIDYATADFIEMHRAHGLREQDALEMAVEWFATSPITQAHGSYATMRARWLRCRRRMLQEPMRYYSSPSSKGIARRIDPPVVMGPNTTPEQKARANEWHNFMKYFPSGRGLYDWETRYWA